MLQENTGEMKLVSMNEALKSQVPDPRTGRTSIEQAVFEWQERAQQFFAQMATESRKSSFGVFERDFIRALLIRAQEAKLYDPTR